MKAVKWLLTVVGSLIITKFYDKIEKIGFFSLVEILINTIWNKIMWILTFEVKVGGLLLFFLTILFIIFLFNLIKKPLILNYNSDEIKGYNWAWQWFKNYNGWDIKDLILKCPKCSTPTKVAGHSLDSYSCPRCNFTLYTGPSQNDVKSIIRDNWNRKYI